MSTKPKYTDVPQLKSKPKYKDAPRFKLIYGYEGEFKGNYSKSVKVMSLELAAAIVKFTKE